MTPIRRSSELSVRSPSTHRCYLSDDVRRRVAVSAATPPHTLLPLAQPQVETPKPVGTELGTSSGPVVVQTQPEGGGSQQENKASDRSAARPNPQQIADRVYQLMRQDLRLERERGGNRAR